jgi:pyruvate/oxaloacetate carboxyltransferase
MILEQMTLTISISAEAESKLVAKAAAAGVDVATFAAKALERAASEPTLEEILAPLRSEFEGSGMTEDELTELLEQAKHEARAERRARKVS